MLDDDIPPRKRATSVVVTNRGAYSFSKGLNIKIAADCGIRQHFSIANPKKFLPLAKGFKRMTPDGVQSSVAGADFVILVT